MNENNVFLIEENSQNVEMKSNGNCKGHFRSMEVGGNGHYPGDHCGCDGGGGTTVPVDNLIYPLVVTAVVIILLFRNKLKLR